ncbi:MAG TPA: autotransporter-associated beta strand repeat-containing protein [Candidatus Acidoferrales bacterium]|jgi:autotransporter-associated beta strand protein|nr:autotransporter-associated beta strand repeat-containing protein [Candidatus Acidoferrales bacterium]
MKQLTRTLQTCIALAIMVAMPNMVSAATKKFTISLSPTATNVLAGVATNVAITVTDTSSAGNFTGIVTNGVTVSPAGQGVTASYSSSSLVIFSNSPTVPATGTASLTLYVSATAVATPNIVYTITVTGSNVTASGNVPSGIASAKYSFIVGNVPTMTWNPGGVDLNWSTGGNWSPNGPPGLFNDATFIDLGAVGSAGTVDNTVDANSSIGSLTFGQTNNFHTTQIASGKTLTVGGDTVGLVVGTGTDNGAGQVTTAAISGAGGTLLVTNTAANVLVSQNHSVTSGESTAQATLDLSGLDKFTATVSRLVVGADLSIKGASGVLNLAKTNTISLTAGATAPQIDIGDNSLPQGSAAVPSILLLGKTNGFFADSIAVGRGKTDNTGSSISFNGIFTGASAYFRGTNGSVSRVGTWSIGDAFGSKVTSYSATVGTCDFSGGTVDALVDTMYVGKGADANIANGANIPGLGMLTVGQGIMDVNTLQVGVTMSVAGTGTVNVNGGTLLVNTNLELANGAGSSGTLNVSNAVVTANTGITIGGGSATINLTGGTLNLTNPTATIGAGASPVNSFSVSNSTLNLSVQALLPTVAANNLAANGTVNTLNVKTVPVLMGFPTQFPVIKYGINGGGASGDLTTFAVGTLPSASPAYGAYISNNVANNSVDIVFTNGPSTPALTWDGATNGNWDTTTKNWRPMTGPDTTYANGNFATFDDSLTGTPNVNLTTALTPATLTVNNSTVSYVFSGGGSLGGSMTLVKNGSGTLTLSETGGDNFSGGIFVNNGLVIVDSANANITGGTTINPSGKVQVGNNDTNGFLPQGGVSDSGALVFSNAANITVGNVISGAGTLTQSDTNIVNLSGNNTFSGPVMVAEGTLLVGNSNGLGLATSVTVNSGATLDVGGQSLYGTTPALAVTVSGAGVGGNGALISSTNDQTKVFHSVTLTGNTTFGGSANWDIRNSSGNVATADASLNGAYNLTKVGTNTVSFRGVSIDSGLGDINIQAGSLVFTATTTAQINSLGDPTKTITVATNATLTLDTLSLVLSKNIVLNDGATLKGSSTNFSGGPVTFGGPVAFAGNVTSTESTGAAFMLTNIVSGSGKLTKSGSGVLFLGGAANTFSGSVSVSGGTLALTNVNSTDGNIPSGVSGISIGGNTRLDVSGRSDDMLTLTGGQVLSGGTGTNGAGAIIGNLIASVGSFVAPGSGTTNNGTLSVSSNATLHGTTTMKLNAAAGACDQLTANAITYDGALVVTNFGGTITNGQVFQLFVATNGYSGTFGSITLPSAAGLTWTNTLTANGTITAGVVATTPVSPGHITIIISGSNVIISGTNGSSGQQYEVLTSTNLTVALTNWTSIATNTFGGGNFSTTNTFNPLVPQTFYILRLP